MSKAVLVMDMPKYCDKCPCLKNMDGINYCSKDDEVFRKIGKASTFYYIQKPDWCPLIPEPKRQLNSAQHVIDRSQKTGQDPKLIGSYNLGWNACLDAIEGREE